MLRGLSQEPPLNNARQDATRGLEQLVYHLAEGLFKRPHQVTVVCPEGSELSEGIEVVATGVREEEEAAWARCRGRLEASEWPMIMDASWQRRATMSNAQRDLPLPIANWHHLDPSIYRMQPPVRYPLWVELSKSHAVHLFHVYHPHCEWGYKAMTRTCTRATGRTRGDRHLAVTQSHPTASALPNTHLKQC